MKPWSAISFPPRHLCCIRLMESGGTATWGEVPLSCRKGASLSAKHKLNSAHVNGALIIAAGLGIATGSITLFLIVVAVLIGEGLHNGDIRK